MSTCGASPRKPNCPQDWVSRSSRAARARGRTGAGPWFRLVPPTRLASTSVTSAPSSRACSAAVAPAGPPPSELRLGRRFGWVIPVFIVLVTAIVAYNARATSQERGSALVVNIAARQRALVERYTKDGLLVLDGFKADPEVSSTALHQDAAALLDGGT